MVPKYKQENQQPDHMQGWRRQHPWLPKEQFASVSTYHHRMGSKQQVPAVDFEANDRYLDTIDNSHNPKSPQYFPGHTIQKRDPRTNTNRSRIRQFLEIQHRNKNGNLGLT